MENKGITKEDLKRVIEYVFREKKNYVKPISDNILYICDSSGVLSFKYGNFMTGLDGIKYIYKSGIGLDIEDISYNGKILSEDGRKSLISQIFSTKKNIKTEKCTLYTPTTDNSDRCLICGELKYKHNDRV